MLWTVPPTGLPRKHQRLFAAIDAFSVTDYNVDGSINTVRITPAEPDRLWQTTPNPASPGKPFPCDPLRRRPSAPTANASRCGSIPINMLGRD